MKTPTTCSTQYLSFTNQNHSFEYKYNYETTYVKIRKTQMRAEPKQQNMIQLLKPKTTKQKEQQSKINNVE